MDFHRKINSVHLFKFKYRDIELKTFVGYWGVPLRYLLAFLEIDDAIFYL